ncbi:MAG: CopD family protein [Chloroflexi bacterium]|nr:CopD family protein [Chloroflexota bacterium]
MSINSLVIWIHLSAAVIWVGIITFQALPFTPIFSDLDLEARGRLVQQSTRRLLPLTWGSIIVLVLTGVWNTIFTPIASEPPITSLEELDALLITSFGQNLLVKHIFVVGTILFTAWHNFFLAPRLSFPPGSYLHRHWRWAGVVSGLNLLAAIGVLFFAAQVLFSLR